MTLYRYTGESPATLVLPSGPVDVSPGDVIEADNLTNPNFTEVRDLVVEDPAPKRKENK